MKKEEEKKKRRRDGEFAIVSYSITVQSKQRLQRYFKKYPDINKSQMIDQLINRHLDNLKVK